MLDLASWCLQAVHPPQAQTQTQAPVLAQTPKVVAQMAPQAVIQAATVVKMSLRLADTERVCASASMPRGMAMIDTVSSSNMGMNCTDTPLLRPEGVWNSTINQVVKEHTVKTEISPGAIMTGRMVSLQEQTLLTFQAGALPARSVFLTATGHTLDRTSKPAHGKAAGNSLHSMIDGMGMLSFQTGPVKGRTADTGSTPNSACKIQEAPITQVIVMTALSPVTVLDPCFAAAGKSMWYFGTQTVPHILEHHGLVRLCNMLYSTVMSCGQVFWHYICQHNVQSVTITL